MRCGWRGCELLENPEHLRRSLLPGKLRCAGSGPGPPALPAAAGWRAPRGIIGDIARIFTIKHHRGIATNIRHRAAPATEDRRSAGERLNQHRAARLQQRGENKTSGVAKQQGHVLMGNIADKFNLVRAALAEPAFLDWTDILWSHTSPGITSGIAFCPVSTGKHKPWRGSASCRIPPGVSPREYRVAPAPGARATAPQNPRPGDGNLLTRRGS